MKERRSAEVWKVEGKFSRGVERESQPRCLKLKERKSADVLEVKGKIVSRRVGS